MANRWTTAAAVSAPAGALLQRVVGQVSDALAFLRVNDECVSLQRLVAINFSVVIPRAEEAAMTQQTPAGSAAGANQKARLGGGALASIVGAGLLLIVVLQNTEDVTINFLFWSFVLPLWLFALGTAVLGALLWFGLGVMRRHRRRKARRA